MHYNVGVVRTSVPHAALHLDGFRVILPISTGSSAVRILLNLTGWMREDGGIL